MAGVPRALQGRTARTDPTFAPASGTRQRRQHEQDAPETVQLLDEEVWQVERAGTGRDST